MRRNQRARLVCEILIVIILIAYFELFKPTICEDKTDWSQYAYISYVTNSDYLCNSVMMFETLHRLGSKADRLMLVPAQFGAEQSWILDLMLKARDDYSVRLKLIDIQSRGGDCAYFPLSSLLLVAGTVADCWYEKLHGPNPSPNS
jgi:hypothetical protein